MGHKVLIFTATYNEADNIETFLQGIDKLNFEVDVLIIDDNSPDQTWKIVKDYSKNKENIHLIIRNKKEGLDTAHKTAYNYSIRNNYDFLITMDADLSHEPKAIPEFINRNSADNISAQAANGRAAGIRVIRYKAMAITYG